MPESPYQQRAYELSTLVLRTIGDKYGATDDFINRDEDNASALPPKLKKSNTKIHSVLLGINFPLRLFCYKISEHLVVLFNGGVKNADSAQKSQLSMKFYEARNFASKIQQAILDGDIIISTDGRRLMSFDGTDNIIL